MLKPLWLLNALQLRPRYRPRSPTVLNTSAATLACQNLARLWPKVGTSADIAVEVCQTLAVFLSKSNKPRRDFSLPEPREVLAESGNLGRYREVSPARLYLAS